ncbi:nitronate monooxygenase [bacterium]|nr:nitronate monooxygenase [bacterium]
MKTVCEILGCRYPIIQGAMGVISNPEFVAAVSEAGGFGTLATAFASSVDVLHQQIKETQKLTRHPFGANLQVMNPLTEQFAELLAESGIKTVTISGGSPKALMPRLKSFNMNVIPVVPSVSVAVKSAALGVDAIIAEGSESGGIQGFKGASTMVLVPSIVDAVTLPVIAAGGIADSRGYRAALALGAGGVQVGTRFIVSRECIAHANYKEAIVARTETDTGLLNMGGFQIRALRTPLTEKMVNDPSLLQKGFSGAGIEESWLQGDLDAGILAAGEVIGLIHNVLTVREIIEEMIKER